MGTPLQISTADKIAMTCAETKLSKEEVSWYFEDDEALALRAKAEEQEDRDLQIKIARKIGRTTTDANSLLRTALQRSQN